jgi:carboxylesterase type B
MTITTMTSTGRVRSPIKDGPAVFRGIAYAQPSVGEVRAFEASPGRPAYDLGTLPLAAATGR